MTPWLDDGDVRLYHGDALDQLREMPSESVHCLVTSPPFFQLRDYGVAGQIGLEATLSDWVASLVSVFAEAKRVLRSDATAWIEIGDSYAGKQLAGAPWRLAFALQEAGWFLRSEIIWARQPPNPMPESVTDRPTKAHSSIFLLTKSAKYAYDADAIREADGGSTATPYVKHANAAALSSAGRDDYQAGLRNGFQPGSGRNARSVWSIPTEPTPFAHFATFPQALVERCVKAGTSERGACSECGAPWRRITERIAGDRSDAMTPSQAATATGGNVRGASARVPGWRKMKPDEIVDRGWEPSCKCSDEWPPEFRVARNPCVVLDPFMGSGTTALVARRLGRHAIGIELNHEYLAISATRLQQLSLLA